jgi:hypothetical protein
MTCSVCPESLAHFNPDLVAHFNPEYPLMLSSLFLSFYALRAQDKPQYFVTVFFAMNSFLHNLQILTMLILDDI